MRRSRRNLILRQVCGIAMPRGRGGFLGCRASWQALNVLRPRRNIHRVSRKTWQSQAVLSQALHSMVPVAAAGIPWHAPQCVMKVEHKDDIPCRASRATDGLSSLLPSFTQRPSKTSASLLGRSRCSPPRRRSAMTSALSIIIAGAKRFRCQEVLFSPSYTGKVASETHDTSRQSIKTCDVYCPRCTSSFLAPNVPVARMCCVLGHLDSRIDVPRVILVTHLFERGTTTQFVKQTHQLCLGKMFWSAAGENITAMSFLMLVIHQPPNDAVGTTLGIYRGSSLYNSEVYLTVRQPAPNAVSLRSVGAPTRAKFGKSTIGPDPESFVIFPSGEVSAAASPTMTSVLQQPGPGRASPPSVRSPEHRRRLPSKRTSHTGKMRTRHPSARSWLRKEQEAKGGAGQVPHHSLQSASEEFTASPATTQFSPHSSGSCA